MAAWTGRPCHVITTNDYLAERDAQNMRGLYDACNVTVAAVHSQVERGKRSIEYSADVVYVTPKELLADYMRDQVASVEGQSPENEAFRDWLGTHMSDRPKSDFALVRGLHSAIIDEADSVLVDEAVTPLILSATRSSRGLREAVEVVSHIASNLKPQIDYYALQHTQSIELLSGAIETLECAAATLPSVWRPAPPARAVTSPRSSCSPLFSFGTSLCRR